jgi:hypothetical protein
MEIENIKAHHIKNEAGVIWVDKDYKKYPYLREKCQWMLWRTRFPRKGFGPNAQKRLIAYTEISVSVKGYEGHFHRRHWILKKNNDCWDKNAPCEGVKTSSIRAGVPSKEGRDYKAAAGSKASQVLNARLLVAQQRR